MGVAAMVELKPNVPGKRSLRPSSSMRHTTEWPISDVSSDLTIEVGSASFALHKFPLVSRSGRIRKLLSDAKDSKMSRISVPQIPGGAQAFEIAAKFCYGINTEITVTNVAMLRCVSHFLEMTEEYAQNNLETRAEAYITDIVLPNISKSISVLHQCENLSPIAEGISLVSRIITAIANNACKEQLSSRLSKLEHNFPRKKTANMGPEMEMPSDWWGKSLAVLSVDLFQRLMSALKCKGLKQDLISKILVNYAHTSLQGAVVRDHQGGKGSCMDTELQKKQRVIVEAMVRLLPTPSRKGCVPMAFLSSLLKSATAASASTSCKADLERRIGLQLDQAVLEDILLPAIANSHGNSHSLRYDIDVMLRVLSIFLNMDEDDQLGDDADMAYEFGSPKQSSVLKVSKLVDSYLAEVALDSSLTPSKFTELAELLPDEARIVSDGLYKAVDIFLKVHPNVKDNESYRLCKAIDCQKLTHEACRDAAQNERLPVQMAVQVLYLEQMRLKKAISGDQRSSSGAISPRDNYASVRRENRELKLEVARMRMRLTDLEKDHNSMKEEVARSSKPGNKLIRSLSKRLGGLNSFFRVRRNKAVPSNFDFNDSLFRVFGRTNSDFRHHSVS